jgi:hypothetical protein
VTDHVALRKPFPASAIVQVNKGFGPIDTINHAVVTDRLLKAAGDWTYTIDETFSHDKTFWIRGTLTIDGVSRPEYGEGADPKKALSDFLKRAAMRFGVALDLWAKGEFEEYDVGESMDDARITRGSPSPTGEQRSPTPEPVLAVASSKATSPTTVPAGSGGANDGGGGGALGEGATSSPAVTESERTATLLIQAVERFGTLGNVVRKAHKLDESVRTEGDLTSQHLVALLEGVPA